MESSCSNNKDNMGFIGDSLLALGVLSQAAVSSYIGYEYYQVFLDGQEPLWQQVIIGQYLLLWLLCVLRLFTGFNVFTPLVKILTYINFALFMVQAAAAAYVAYQGHAFTNELYVALAFVSSAVVSSGGYLLSVKTEPEPTPPGTYILLGKNQFIKV